MFCGVWEKSTTRLFKVKNLSKEFKQKQINYSNYICRILLYTNLDKIDIISYYIVFCLP